MKKKKLNSHFVMLAALSFVLALIVGELIIIVFQLLRNDTTIDTYSVMLYVIPAVSAIVTCSIIYGSHRTLDISNTLNNAISKVADGNYDHEIQYKKKDSFNAVYENFNKMVKELKSVKTLREDFIREFSHEFKTPIASINGFANLLLDGGLTEEEKAGILRIIADESQRLSHLSENIMMISQLENQQFVGDKKAFRLDVQIKDCVIMLERQWAEKDITINSDLPTVTVKADETLLKHVWLNLISNAIKFTPKGGEINITLKQENGRAVATVADNGVGIAEDALPKIFDKYYQADAGKGGNGLGLAICKRIVGLCNGEISVKSHIGEGTAFTVKL